MAIENKLTVEGMTCNHCKMTVEKAVDALQGVTNVEVDLEGKSVAVRYDESQVGLPQIKETIEAQGYRVS